MILIFETKTWFWIGKYLTKGNYITWVMVDYMFMSAFEVLAILLQFYFWLFFYNSIF